MQQGHFRLRQAAVSGHGRGHWSSPRQPLYALAPSRTVVGGSREVTSQALLSVHLTESLPPQEHGLITRISAGHVQNESSGRCKRASLGLRLGARTLEKLSEAPPHSASVPHAIGTREQMKKLSHGADKGFCRSCKTESDRAARACRHHMGATPQARCEALQAQNKVWEKPVRALGTAFWWWWPDLRREP